MSGHVARHVLEESLVPGERAAEVRAHLAECERCARRLEWIERARAQFRLEHPAAEFARVVSAAARQRRVPRRPALGWAVLGTALAVIAVAFGLRAPPPAAIRYRGASASWQVYVRSESGIRPVLDGEELSAGAQLAFNYRLGEPQYLLLFGLEEDGTITRYFPETPTAHALPLSAGTTRQLPVGIELDAKRGRERLIALFSSAELDEAQARAAIASAWRAARAQGKGMSEPLELPLAATQLSLWFEKP